MGRRLVGRRGSKGAQGRRGRTGLAGPPRLLRDLAGRRAPEVTRESGDSLDGRGPWQGRAGDPR